MNHLQDLLDKLIRFESITPEDQGCQVFMQDYLNKLGFECLDLSLPPVANFFARLGKKPPLLVFSGHSDVVAPGNLASWTSPPFELSEHNNILYGRGVADMKGSLAAMLTMAKRFVQEHPQFSGSLGFLITSGEEGDEFAKGTPYVLDELKKRGVKIDYSLVGEPTSEKQLGDTLKIGRRGSLSAKLRLKGKQGHVAYPHLAENPIHRLSPALTNLVSMSWDEGNAYFPPTTLQITKIQAGGLGGNVIPGEIELDFNFRFSPLQTVEGLKQKVDACFKQYDLEPSILWKLSGLPFLTQEGRLTQACSHAIQAVTGQKPTYSTSGGTSDARFIAPHGIEVIEFGPINATIHQANESLALEDLKQLTEIYYQLCRIILCP